MKQAYIKNMVALALAEDLGKGDITTNNLIHQSALAQANIIFKSDGVVCGLGMVEAVFKKLSKKIEFQRKVSEGARVKKGKVVAVIKGPARAILTGERVALNFLRHLSGIATTTRAFVDHIKPYKVKIMDTRKTTPLLRVLERYAVRVGGGHNHRLDLSQMVMIKDNHRFLVQNLSDTITMMKAKTKKLIELEVDASAQLPQALSCAVDIILLDNMSPPQVQCAVRLRHRLKSKILLEASGNIGLHNVRAFAKSGVDRISVGALTASPAQVDISLDFI